MKKTILIACLGLVSLGLQAQGISLAGEWNVELGKSGSAFAKSKRASQGEMKRAILPGTIDTNHLGFAPKDTMETTHLTRLYAYKGAARYSRTINIPKDWKKKPVELFLERTRPTWVYVDGELVDSCNFISTPQRYLLPKKVTRPHLSRSSSTFLRVSVRLIPIFLRLSPIPSPSVQRGSKDSIGI